MIQQIVVNDENQVKIGNTFPRRAKQLVNKKRAKWLNKAHTEIVLMPTEIGGTEMVKEISAIADKLFEDAPQNSETNDVKQEFSINLNKKYEDLIAGGMDREKAIDKIIQDVGNTNQFVKSLSKEKSLVKDAYRDSAIVVMRSSPIEIIKKSKRRTRELHTAVSLVLWTSALILYLVGNYLCGNRYITLNPTEISSSWLIFIFAALIECILEIYFSRKELDVLNENIDIRQINPLKGGDIDLIGYKQKLMFKIRLMFSAVIWIPLALVFFISGYISQMWNIVWVVFLFGIFFEVLQNLIRTLKKAD